MNINDAINRIVPRPLHPYTRKLKMLFLKLQTAFPPMHSNNQKKIMKFRNIHSGKRCFVLGNGPSLKISDLTRLHELKQYTFASNRIYLAFGETAWRPTYYCALDDLFFRKNADFLEQLSGFPKFFPLQVRDGKWGENIESGYYFRYMTDYHRDGLPRFSFNPAFGVYSGRSVTYGMLQLAFFMGFTSVYLIGMDHNFIIPDESKNKGQVLIDQGQPNHFHRDYYKNGEPWNKPNLDQNEHGYIKAMRIFENAGRKIYNATRGGKLEIYPRVSFDKLTDKIKTDI